MESIKEVLIERDGMTEKDADELIAEAREQLMQYIEDGDMIAADDICMDYFGLEPDYLMEIMPM